MGEANTYKIYTHPQGKCEAVKQGWSWPGTFLWPIWGLIKRMWGPGFLLFEISVIFAFGQASIDAGSAPDFLPFQNHLIDSLHLVVSVVVGFYGNRWREYNLISKGYELTGSLSAASPEDALETHNEEQKS